MLHSKQLGTRETPYDFPDPNSHPLNPLSLFYGPALHPQKDVISPRDQLFTLLRRVLPACHLTSWAARTKSRITALAEENQRSATQAACSDAPDRGTSARSHRGGSIDRIPRHRGRAGGRNGTEPVCVVFMVFSVPSRPGGRGVLRWGFSVHQVGSAWCSRDSFLERFKLSVVRDRKP